MKTILHDLQLNHWQAILLSALPALLNLFIFIYVRIKFPDNKTSITFSLLLLALILFQLGDTFVRMSGSMETAISWNAIFSCGPLFIAPLGLQFCLLYTGRKKYAESFLVQFLLYTPSIILFVLILLNSDSYSFSASPFWGWVYKINLQSYGALAGYWIGLTGIGMLFLLIHYISELERKSDKAKQATIIAIAISIPLLQGVFTETILPLISNSHSVPLSSATLTCFSIGILIALKKYKLFSAADALKTPTILEAMTDILIILSKDKKIEFINKEGEKALGVENSDKENLRIEDFFVARKSTVENFIQKLFIPVLAGGKVLNHSTEFKTKSGETISVLISATSFKSALGETQILLLIHDITNLIQTAQQLATREEELKNKTEELNSFFYQTTHDMKGPVASIVGLTQLAKKDLTPQMTVACLDKIENSAMRLNTILIDFIKIMQIKERKLDISTIDFPKMADDIIQSVKYSTGQDVVDFKTYIDSNISFHGDEKLVDSILYNLVANAVNYRNTLAEKNSFVHIRIHNFGNGIMMKVIDNGIGIKKEIQNKIFNLFFRGSNDSKGTGLGLYILKNAVTKLNGRVELESGENKGTTFTIYLPDLKDDMEMKNTDTIISLVS